MKEHKRIEGIVLFIVIALLIAGMVLTIKCSGRKSRHGYGMKTTYTIYALGISAANGKYIDNSEKGDNGDHRAPVEPVVLLNVAGRVAPGTLLVMGT